MSPALWVNGPRTAFANINQRLVRVGEEINIRNIAAAQEEKKTWLSTPTSEELNAPEPTCKKNSTSFSGSSNMVEDNDTIDNAASKPIPANAMSKRVG
jgi:hypothetical protein